jgi:N-methylhydantoinase B/oxoprolinase/acetone carboxylase alpha subunit
VERVVEDVRNGFIDIDTAARVYGVRLDPATLEVRDLAPERLEHTVQG